jgi:hypothetical protein
LIIRWRAILIGGAAGLLTTVLAALVISTLAGGLGAMDPLAIGVVLGAVVGLFAAGYVAARFSFDHRAFHGSLASLVTVVIIGTDALLRGSGATPLTLAGYALLAALLGGAGGWLGGRSAR